MNKVRTTLTFFAALVALAGFASVGFAQSAADPTGEAPIGIEEKSGAKGPSFTGVLVTELVNVHQIYDPNFPSDLIDVADSARLVARLRRGSTLRAFFAEIPGPIFVNTEDEKRDFQDEVLAAFRNQVLTGFGTDCGNTGPVCVLILKQADEFGLTADTNDNQFAVMDVTVSFAEAP